MGKRNPAEIDITTEVEIHIGRNQGSDTERPYHIELTDGRSNLRIADLRLTAEQFANAIVGSVVVEIETRMTSRPAMANLGLYAWGVVVTFPHDVLPGEYDTREDRLVDMLGEGDATGALGASYVTVSSRRTGLAAHFHGFADTEQLAMDRAQQAAHRVDAGFFSPSWRVLAVSRHPELLGGR